MKKNILTLAFLLLGTGTILANSVIVSNNNKIENKEATKTITFGVRGNCGMCQRTIETAALSVDGVKSATWDKEKKEITVVYESKVNTIDIHKAIASAGYDTDKVSADKKAYNGLPGCCQYDHNQEMQQEVKNHSEEHHH